jgi:putative SOS response-associated peptidase YedK
VPATGFYEWVGPTGSKRPYHMRRQDRGLMAFAGLWEHWLGADGSEIETMAILTTSANATLTPIHDRMPVILAPEHFSPWLDCRSGSSLGIEALLKPAPDDLLQSVEVDRRLNSSRNEGADLLQEVRTTLF